MLATIRRLGLGLFVVFAPIHASGADSNRAQLDHVGAYNFRVEIDGVNAGYFKNVAGLQAMVEVVQRQEGDYVFLREQASSNQSASSNIVLKRGYTANDDLFKWWKKQRGTARNVTLSLVQYPTRQGKPVPNARSKTLCSYTLHQAKLTAFQRNAKDDKTTVGATLIAHEVTHTCQNVLLKPGEKPKLRARQG